jgi:hypothetical protein
MFFNDIVDGGLGLDGAQFDRRPKLIPFGANDQLISIELKIP